jgi:hypothetical protein
MDAFLQANQLISQIHSFVERWFLQRANKGFLPRVVPGSFDSFSFFDFNVEGVVGYVSFSCVPC